VTGFIIYMKDDPAMLL